MRQQRFGLDCPIRGVSFPSLLGEFQAFLCTFCFFYHTFEIASLVGGLRVVRVLLVHSIQECKPVA